MRSPRNFFGHQETFSLTWEPTVANPVYTNEQTEEAKHLEEASSSVCLDDEELEMFVDQQKKL